MGINEIAMKGANRGEMAVQKYGAEQTAEQLRPMLQAILTEQQRTNQLLEWLGSTLAPKS